MNLTAFRSKKHFIVVLVSVLLVTPFLMSITQAQAYTYTSDGYRISYSMTIWTEFYQDSEDVTHKLSWFEFGLGSVVTTGTPTPIDNPYQIKITLNNSGSYSHVVDGNSYYTKSGNTYTVLVPEGGNFTVRGYAYDYSGSNPSPSVSSLYVYEDDEYYLETLLDRNNQNIVLTYNTLEDVESVVNNTYSLATSIYSDTQSIINYSQLILNELIDKNTYQIDYEMIPAYALFSALGGTMDYSDGDIYPHMDISSYNTSNKVYLEEPMYLYYYTYSSSGNTALQSVDPVSSSSGLSATRTLIEYDEISDGFIMRGYKIIPSAAGWYSLSFNDVSFSAIPIYYGNGKNMSQSLQSLTHLQSESLTTTRLKDIKEYVISIYNKLVNDDGASDSAVSQADQLSDKVSEYQGVESDFTADFSDSVSSITGNSSWDISRFGTTVNWFALQLQNIYDKSGDFQLLLTLPMLLGLALFFIGRAHWVGGARSDHKKEGADN